MELFLLVTQKKLTNFKRVKVLLCLAFANRGFQISESPFEPLVETRIPSLFNKRSLTITTIFIAGDCILRGWFHRRPTKE